MKCSSHLGMLHSSNRRHHAMMLILQFYLSEFLQYGEALSSIAFADNTVYISSFYSYFTFSVFDVLELIIFFSGFSSQILTKLNSIV